MTTDNKTRHSPDCRKVFDRYDSACPRCCELLAGAPARPGWGDARRRQEAITRRAMDAHFAPGGRADQIRAAGGVDTAFDW